MIDIIADVVSLVSGIEALGGRVYRQWPQVRAKAPYAVVERIGRSVIQTEADGSEVLASLTYSVDILATSPSELDALEEAVTDTLASYNLHTTGTSPTWESSTKLYRRSITFDGVVDRRGQTFTQ